MYSLTLNQGVQIYILLIVHTLFYMINRSNQAYNITKEKIPSYLSIVIEYSARIINI
jgi:hypothetical protein